MHWFFRLALNPDNTQHFADSGVIYEQQALVYSLETFSGLKSQEQQKLGHYSSSYFTAMFDSWSNLPIQLHT